MAWGRKTNGQNNVNARSIVIDTDIQFDDAKSKSVVYPIMYK